ncbi:MAG TPA: ABC transporter ATP-binding protein [Anaerolineae bacterium]|nr:ABC transporter ATP-binding protein [Anaerolineae bacterium]
MNVVEMRGIAKRFGPVTANAAIDFDLAEGEVHALLGENGAGKSTLMRILYGLYTADAGEIRVRGQVVRFTSPADALAHGIGLVSQHFSLVPTFTVAENIALGYTAGFRFDERAATASVSATAARFQISIDPAVQVRYLSVGEQQRVEILKALHRECRVLILDEPTAVLTPQEAEALFAAIRRLVEQGLSVVFISHKLDEVFAVSDRVTVLRDGRVVGETLTHDAGHASLARLMVGREMAGVSREGVAAAGAPLLRLVDVHALDDRRLPALRGLTLAVGAGEIVGVAGVAGNGQLALAEVLCGLRHPSRGRVFVGNDPVDVTRATPAEVAARGVGRIPEDRLSAVVADLTVADNLALEHLGEFTRRISPLPSWVRTGEGLGVRVLDRDRMRQAAEALISEYGIKAAPGDRARTLSGGNMQKLILARALSRNPRVVIAAEPTRGLDVGATEYVRGKLLEARDRGSAVLLISEDLDEVLALSDRIAVIYEGRLTGVLSASEADPERLGLMMAGQGR